MTNTKKLLEMARKWQRAAASGRKRISWSRKDNGLPNDKQRRSKVACKGHFVVYTVDEKRFMVPMAFLKCRIFEELLQMSAEEFGLPGDGPITLACDARFLEQALCLLKRGVSEDVEKDIPTSRFKRQQHCSRSSLYTLEHCQQLAVF